MKSRHPKFVIEFKSSRRQTKARSNSIWGDTDLKALAREVETDSSQLFIAPHTDSAPPFADAQISDTRSKLEVQSVSGSITAASPEGPGEGLANPEEGVGLSSVPEIAKCELDSKVASTIAPPKRAKRGRMVTRIGAPKRIGVEVDAPTTPAEINMIDEIAALDAENKRLKAELAKRIHAENLQLRIMLSRFIPQ
ncbi:hypothetical protein [Ensifer sp. 4252]|uniref:hypothetical protein n=1 Tax=Ensifer sp. 4252 TaxID=3373915 RepID=UPI003D22D4C5